MIPPFPRTAAPVPDAMKVGAWGAEFAQLVAQLDRPDRDMGKAHLLVQRRWPRLKHLLAEQGITTDINEVYRAELRQQWLYAQGRTIEQCQAKGIDGRFARDGKIVTNAWSAKKSAHGWTEGGVPASCALDVVPVGSDGKPWTADDRWDDFVSLVAVLGAQVGLVHFHAPGKAVTDRPHVQLSEWRDGPIWSLQV